MPSDRPRARSPEGSNDQWTWYLLIKNFNVTNACGGGYLQILKRGTVTDGFASFRTGGACNVELTHPAPNVGDILEGAFTATLAPISGTDTALHAVTNGRFRVPRVAGQPSPLP